jgi:hypothetical protein
MAGTLYLIAKMRGLDVGVNYKKTSKNNSFRIYIPYNGYHNLDNKKINISSHYGNINDDKLYDLEVENENSYTNGEIIFHNSKCKRYYEVNAVTYGKTIVKGQTDVFNYDLGINISQDYYNNLPNKVKVKDKLLYSYGRTDNTKINIEIGNVLRVASEEVLKYENDKYPYYRGYINRVLEPIPEVNISDSLEVLDKLSSFQPKRIPLEEVERINQGD